MSGAGAVAPRPTPAADAPQAVRMERMMAIFVSMFMSPLVSRFMRNPATEVRARPLESGARTHRTPEAFGRNAAT